MTSQFKAYPKNYIQQCFTHWYSHGRPKDMRKLSEPFPLAEDGRKPSPQILRKWRLDNSWERRADDLDAKAMILVDNTLIAQKAKMLQRQAEIGFKLQELGINFLVSGTFDSSSAAVSAVIRGAELERTSRGIGELIVKMSQMSNDELEREIIKRLTQASEAGQIIDAEEIKGEQTEE